MTCFNVSVHQWKLLSKKLSRVYFFFSKDKSFPFCTFQRGRRWNLHLPRVSAANADVYQQVKWVPRQCRLMGAQLQALKWDGKVSRLHGGAWERQARFIALNHTNKGKWVTQACACLHRGQDSREAHPSSHLVEKRPRGSSQDPVADLGKITLGQCIPLPVPWDSRWAIKGVKREAPPRFVFCRMRHSMNWQWNCPRCSEDRYRAHMSSEFWLITPAEFSFSCHWINCMHWMEEMLLAKTENEEEPSSCPPACKLLSYLKTLCKKSFFKGSAKWILSNNWLGMDYEDAEVPLKGEIIHSTTSGSNAVLV